MDIRTQVREVFTHVAVTYQMDGDTSRRLSKEAWDKSYTGFEEYLADIFRTYYRKVAQPWLIIREDLVRCVQNEAPGEIVITATFGLADKADPMDALAYICEIPGLPFKATKAKFYHNVRAVYETELE